MLLGTGSENLAEIAPWLLTPLASAYADTAIILQAGTIVATYPPAPTCPKTSISCNSHHD